MGIFIDYISFFVLVFTSIIGILEIARMTYQLLFDKNIIGTSDTVSITIDKKNAFMAEYIVRGALEKTSGKVVILYEGVNCADPQAKEVLNRMKEQNSRVIML